MLSLLVPLVLGADPFASPCLGASFPAKGAALFMTAAGAKWSDSDSGEFRADPRERIVCSDTLDDVPRRRVWTVLDGVAVFAFVASTDLRPLGKDSWKAYRRPDEEGGQVGCIKAFKKGTRFFDSPDGTAVAVVVDAEAEFGKWASQKTATGFWAGVRGLRATLVWVKVTNDRDWCPL